jgi:hypothetical protein
MRTASEQGSFIRSIMIDTLTLDKDSTMMSFTIVSDSIPQLPCCFSKTWRKNQGWSDLPSCSAHSNSRWVSATSAHSQGVEASHPEAPSPPQRQTSCNSTDWAAILRVRRQSSNSSLSTGSTASLRKKKAFQYPPTLGDLPDDDDDEAPNTTTKTSTKYATPSPAIIPPHRCEASVSSANSMPGLPQRESSDSQPPFSRMNQSLEMNIPTSLFVAPAMPQRQASVSSLGSRQSSVSTISTQDSYRSLNTSVHLLPKDSYLCLGPDLNRSAESYRSLESVQEDKEFHFAPRQQKSKQLDEIRLGPLDHYYGSSDETAASTRSSSSSKKQLESVYVPPTLLDAAKAARRKGDTSISLLRQAAPVTSQTQQKNIIFYQSGELPSADADDAVPAQPLFVL